jgi:aspartyl-tRNA(Asn)/glutamyl-tRNA(Gln) amidotransferase subunit B
MTWETVIGLEVHVQLKTRSKMFCGCSSAFGAPSNTNVCPVCLGLPGALPVLNEGAVRLAVRAALALGCTVHETSVFARKNYFYPDLPKGYQISQFDQPLAVRGQLEIGSPDGKRVTIRITRLHLEEDAGKSFHDRVPGMTAVDFNRAGVPLCEIVSEPDLRSPADARAYLVALKQVLEYLEVSDCNMEEGSLRVDANVSVRKPGAPLGTKQEVKNMNSFAAVERALGQLRDQQIARLEGGGAVELTTFSAGGGDLRAMRTKEQSHDYRYFPEPDLPPLVLAAGGIDTAAERAALPELPAAARARFEKSYGLSPYDAGVVAATRGVSGYFEAVVKAGAEAKDAANWVMGSVLQDANANAGVIRVAPGVLAALIALVKKGSLSHLGAKQVFGEMAEGGGEPESVAQRLGVIQVGDTGQIQAWVESVLKARGAEVERFRGGEAKLMGFFVGEVMKLSKGKADPKAVQALIKQTLG